MLSWMLNGFVFYFNCEIQIINVSIQIISVLKNVLVYKNITDSKINVVYIRMAHPGSFIVVLLTVMVRNPVMLEH